MKKVDAIMEAIERLKAVVARWQAIGGADGDEVLKNAELLYFDEFCPWAAGVVAALGLAVFGEPGDPPLVTWQTKPWNPCQIITGTPNTVEAGQRVIFWSAAYHDPELCQRTSPSYKVTVREWALDWLVIAPGPPGFRTFHQALNWAASALRHRVQIAGGDQAQRPDRMPDGERPKKRQRRGVNARMLELLQQDVTCRGWTVKRWALYLGCARSSVVATTTWRELALMRQSLRIERANDRRRRVEQEED